MLRRAAASDVKLLAQLARDTFCETFTHYTPQALAAFLEEDYCEKVIAGYLSDPGCEVWVAEMNGALVAYGKWGSCKLPLASHPERIVELHRLYVQKPHHGRRLGAQFMQQFFAFAGAKKAQAAYLGVWERNVKAQQFYARYGFEKVGEYNYKPVGKVVDREWILEKKL